jgi:hypothetical protein
MSVPATSDDRMPTCQCRFLRSRTKYDVADVGHLYDLAMQLVHATASVIPLSCKWLQVASKILRTYRPDLRGVKTLEMEPYWQLFSNLMDKAYVLSFEGSIASSHRVLVAELCKLVRFFIFLSQTHCLVCSCPMRPEFHHSIMQHISYTPLHLVGASFQELPFQEVPCKQTSSLSTLVSSPCIQYQSHSVRLCMSPCS